MSGQILRGYRTVIIDAAGDLVGRWWMKMYRSFSLHATKALVVEKVV